MIALKEKPIFPPMTRLIDYAGVSGYFQDHTTGEIFEAVIVFDCHDKASLHHGAAIVFRLDCALPYSVNVDLTKEIDTFCDEYDFVCVRHIPLSEMPTFTVVA